MNTTTTGDDFKKERKEKDNKFSENHVSTDLFEGIEQEFKNVLEGVVDDERNNTKLLSFRIEYEKLFDALKKSYTHEKFLAKKCEELSSEITKNSTNVKSALQNSQQEQNTIGLLKQDAKKAWSLVEAGKKREELNSTCMKRLQNEVNDMSKELQEERTNFVKQEESLNQVLKDCNNTKTRDTEMEQQINYLEKERSEFKYYQEELESKIDALQEKNEVMAKEISANEGELVRIRSICDSTEADMLNLKSRLEKKTKDYVDLQFSSSLAKNKSEQLGKDLSEANRKLELQATESSELNKQMVQLSTITESQKNKMKDINTELDNKRQELKLAAIAQNNLESNNTQLQRKLDGEHRNVLRLQQAVDNAKSLAQKYKKDFKIAQEEFDKASDREETALQQASALEREKNIQIGKIQRCDHRASSAAQNILHQEQTIITLEKDLFSSKDNNGALQQHIFSLEKVCTKHSNDLASQEATTENANETIRLQDLEMHEMRKELRRWEEKMTDQVHVCNKLRSERGRISRQNLLSQEEISTLKDNVHAQESEFQALRSELASKNEFLVKEHFDKKQEKTEKEHASKEVLKLNQQIDEQHETIQNQDLDIHRLNSTLKQLEEEMRKHRKEYDQIINERDILGAQLIRRNDELALILERVKVQESTLKKGEIQYQDRISDLRHLAINIQDMQRELNKKRNKSSFESDQDHPISRELIKKERELLEERIKVKTLSDELENPLNVHRWRKLEGSDPSTFELIQKIEMLQKRLIRKTEQVIEKDGVIQDQEHQYLVLKKQRSRQPGMEIVEKLSARETEVRSKEKQMKAMAGELNMNQAQVSEMYV